MDASTVWQWRIMHVKKYSRRPEPFHYSSKMGLDFNVGSNTQKKLDLQLVTNGVILEICDFARTVNKSERHFIANILANNFDLGLKDEQQRIEFTSQILHKVRDLIRKPPEDKREGFILFDASSEPECTSNSKTRLNMASTEHKADSLLVDMDDDTAEGDYEDEFKCSRAPSKENIKTEEMDGHHADDSEGEFECSGPQSTEELKEDVLPLSFPCCEEIGLNLDVGSKQTLDPGLLTKGVMLELAHFTRVLTGSYRPIVLSVLEHNFELDLKSQKGKNQVWFKVLDMLKRREQPIAISTEISPEFKGEPFSFQTNSFKKVQAPSTVGVPPSQFKEVAKIGQSCLKIKQEKRALSTTNGQVSKQRRREQAEQKETNTLGHHTDLCTGQAAEGDHRYMCPLDSDEVTDSENAESQDDNQSESEASFQGPFLLLTDCSSSLQTVNSNVNPPFVGQPDKRGLCGDEEEAQIPRNVPNKCDMKQEEIETQSNMWKLRATRGKQILLLDKEYCSFKKSKRFGLEFDVGFGPKQNFSVDSLTNSVLLEVARFALAMNSSQEDFIMEILEYNFDFGLKNKTHRKTFACQVMSRVKRLKNSEDAVKFSKEVFELPGPVSSVISSNRSTGSFHPELSSISRTEDVDAMCPPDSHAETKERSVDLYPFCSEIGLKLNVICSQPHKKLDVNKLTNGAMTEVTNFAEKLCGTFEQICLDVLKHNFGLVRKNEGSDLGRDILARIPVIMDQRSLSTCITSYQKMKHPRKDSSKKVSGDCQNNRHLDTCSTDTSQAPIIDQTVGSSTETEQENELNLRLWKLRADQIQQILSVPHGEHCPFYSYSRCKNIGIDFNVGSGVTQNLDPKLLTNGIMVEVKTFANTLQSAQKDFITEILEYNLHLNLNNELYRSSFAYQVMEKFKIMKLRNKKNSIPRMNMLFELPDSRCIEEFTYPKTKYCPKCYQDRNSKLRQDESDPSNVLQPRPLAATNPASAEANSTAQKSADDLSSTFRATEETIMESYPRCKKVGLRLCVDKDQPKDKLDRHVLTHGVMNEVASFARRLCGTKNKLINDVLEHNFSLNMQSRDVNPAVQFHRMTALHSGAPTWFREVFVVQPCCHRDPGVKKASVTQKDERKETTKKRKLALQTKKEKAKLPSDNMGVGKYKRNRQSTGDCTPICTEIGLDLDVTSKSGHKEKLDLKLLTRAVVMEIYKSAVKKVGHYLPDVLYDILDYNFDLSSQRYRRWEFTIATSGKMRSMVKTYRKNLHRADEVFKLPFVFERKESKKVVPQKQNKRSAESSVEEPDKTAKGVVRKIRYHSDVNCVYFLDNVNINKDVWFDEEDTKSPTDPGTIMQMTGSQVSSGCDSFQGNVRIKEEEHDPHYGDIKPEPDTEEKYHPHCEDIKTESNTEDVKHLVQGEPAGSLEYTLITICPNSESNVKRDSEVEVAHYYNMAEPQVSEGNAMLAVRPNTESGVKTEWDTEGVKYVVPAEAAGPQGSSMITVCQDTERAWIKEEQGNVPVESYHRQ